jgi:NlpC/P60 family putative phage cell wall peptidase
MQNDTIVRLARGWIGTPYLHQASVRGAGTDCLGLLRGVWREAFGEEPMAVPPYSADWSEVSGEEALAAAADHCLRRLPIDAEVAGAVLLFRMRDGAVAKHLGIAAEVGPRASFVHAYTGHGVVESPLSAPWAKRIVGRFAFPD